MITERVEGLGRNGVNCLRPDKFFHVNHVAILRILGAGGSPQLPLRHGALSAQLGKTLAVEDVLVRLISQLGVGDGYLAEQSANAVFGCLICGRIQFGRQLFLHGGVNTADKKAGHRAGTIHRLAGSRQAFQPADIGLSHLLVNFLGKNEGDVDVQTGSDSFFNSGNALRRGRDLDHYVGPVQRRRQTLGLFNGFLGLIAQLRTDLEAGIAIQSAGRIIDGAQHVGSRANVFDHQRLINFINAGAAIGELAQFFRVIGAAADGLLEDRGIRSQAAESIFADHTFQFAAGKQAAAHLVVPDALPQFAQLD